VPGLPEAERDNGERITFGVIGLMYDWRLYG